MNVFAKFTFLTLTLFLATYFIFSEINLVYSANTDGIVYNMDNTSHFNYRIDGFDDTFGTIWYLGFADNSISIRDYDGDGKKDIMVSSQHSTIDGVSEAGHVTFINNNTIFNSGKTFSLGQNNNPKFDFQLVGSSAGEELGYFSHINTTSSNCDFDGDNKLDMVFGSEADDNGPNSGALYFFKDDLISSFSKDGSVHKMDDSSNYSLKLLGDTSSNYFGSVFIHCMDINLNGKSDLVVLSSNYSSTGSVFVISDAIINNLLEQAPTFPGKKIDVSNNFNYRIDGSNNSVAFGFRSTGLVDITNDNIEDLFIGSYGEDYNGNNSGSTYFIDGTKFNDLSSSANIISLSDTSNYLYRMDGPEEDGQFSREIRSVGDIDGDSKDDIILGSYLLDYNGNNSGSAFVFFNEFFDAYSGNGNVISIGSSNFNLRIDGADAGDGLGNNAETVLADLTYDGKDDLLIPAYSAETSSGLSNGVVYLISGSKLDDFKLTSGNTINMADSSNYLAVFEGDTGNQDFPGADNFSAGVSVADLNNDGRLDFVFPSDESDYVDNGRSNPNSGSIFILLNFPHYLDVSYDNDSESLIGNISSFTSFSKVRNIQWSFSNEISSNWKSCTANDGSFNSSYEEFTCNVDENRNVYLRAVDEAGSYTKIGSYRVFGRDDPDDGEIILFIDDDDESISITNTRRIRIKIDADSGTGLSTIDEMKVSSNEDFDDVDWREFKDEIEFELKDTSDTQSVYVILRDSQGVESKTYVAKIRYENIETITESKETADISSKKSPISTEETVLGTNDTGTKNFNASFPNTTTKHEKIVRIVPVKNDVLETLIRSLIRLF